MPVDLLPSGALDDADRDALRLLWDRAFGDRFDAHDAAHAFGGVHAVVRSGGRVVAHASLVPRRVRFADGPWREVGYVEAVATDPDRRREGLGRDVVVRLHEEVGVRWRTALLSTGRAAPFYEALGWERWQGAILTQAAAGVVPDDRHGGVLVLRLDPALVPDLTVPVTCEDRPGSAW